MASIAEILVSVDPAIPFTILAFFPEYRMKNYRSPTVDEMVSTYKKVKSIGLLNVRLGNIGVFAPTETDLAYLAGHVDKDAY